MTLPDRHAQSHHADIVQKFLAARQSAEGFDDYPGVLPATLADAYAIQDLAIAAYVEPIAGWKVGRIMPPISSDYGADRLSGPIFAHMVTPASPNATGRIFAQGFGAAEAEFLLRIGTVPEPGKTDFTLAEAAALIDAVHIGIEIASSPFSGINDHGPAVTVSDFGNNNGLLIGPAIDDFRNVDFIDIDVTLMIDDVIAGKGHANAFVDGVIGAARFLLNNLAGRGIAVEPGTWISSGAVTGVHPVQVGQKVKADFGPLGSVSCTIEAQKPR